MTLLATREGVWMPKHKRQGSDERSRRSTSPAQYPPRGEVSSHDLARGDRRVAEPAPRSDYPCAGLRPGIVAGNLIRETKCG
jgi:hypothetical protein